MIKKILVTGSLILSSMSLVTIQAASSNNFIVNSGQMVSSGSIASSSNFKVQTKQLTVGVQGISDSFQIQKTEQSAVTTPSPTTTPTTTTPTTSTPETATENTSSGGGGNGGNRTYNPQALLSGNLTTNKKIRYESKMEEQKRKINNFYFAQQGYDLNFNPAIDSKETKKTVSIKTTKINNENNIKTNDENIIKVVSTKESDSYDKRNKNNEIEELTFFDTTKSFEIESAKLLAKTEQRDIWYSAAPIQKESHHYAHHLWLMFIAFLVGVIVGASCEHFRFIKTHSHNLWKKIKAIALKIWKI